MSPHARQLYLLLVLAADRRGLSFYGIRRCQQILGLSETQLRHARMELIEMQLLASDGTTHQLLALPATHPVQPAPMMPTPGVRPAAGGRTTTEAPNAPGERHVSIPEDTREILRDIFGRDEF